jgi:hypothetical protein
VVLFVTLFLALVDPAKERWQNKEFSGKARLMELLADNRAEGIPADPTARMAVQVVKKDSRSCIWRMRKADGVGQLRMSRPRGDTSWLLNEN